MDDTKERCPSCGEPLYPDDLYCASCGRAVGASARPGASVAAAKGETPGSEDQPTMPMPVAGGPPPPADSSPQDIGADADPPLVGDTPAFNYPPPPTAAEVPPVAEPIASEPVRVAEAATWTAAVGPPPPSKPKRKVTPWIVAGLVVLLAVIGGLVWALISTSNDLDEARANTSSSSEEVANLNQQVEDLNTVISQQQQQIADLQTQLDQANSDLTAAQEALATEQQATETANAAAEQAQADLQAAQEQLAVLQGLFPMDDEEYRGADPTGNYGVAVDADACTLAECGSISSMTIDIPDRTRVQGDRTNGALTFDGQSFINEGAVATANRPTCEGAPVDATYRLALHANGVDQTEGALSATGLAGTYTETVTAGECAGQFRAFDLVLTKE